MELYTLISLVIGVFGATYAALNALRSNLDPEVNDAHKNCDGMFGAIVAKDKENGIVPHCQKHVSRIKTCRRVWRWANAIPAMTFFILITLMVSWVLLDWENIIQHHDGKILDEIMQKFPWSWLKGMITITGIINIVCVTVACFAYKTCSANYQGLSAHHDGVKQKLPTLTAPGATAAPM